MTNEVYYFGYGANRDSEMMSAIIGRVPDGFPTKVFGYELCIQKWEEMPPNVRQELIPSWDEMFRSYILRPSEHSDRTVFGMVWKITKQEQILVDAWELVGRWYQAKMLDVLNPINNKTTQVEVQYVENSPQSKVVNGVNYEIYLNDKEKMLTIAKKARQFSV